MKGLHHPTSRVFRWTLPRRRMYRHDNDRLAVMRLLENELEDMLPDRFAYVFDHLMQLYAVTVPSLAAYHHRRLRR